MEKIEREGWAERVEAASRHPGGVSGYCREHGIGRSRLHYWKKNLAEQKKSAARVAPFARVEVVAAKASWAPSLPDARWLAEFLARYSEVSR